MSVATSPSRTVRQPLATLKDIIGKYSRRLSQEKVVELLTQRKLSSSGMNNEVNSLASTQKHLRVLKENIVFKDIIVKESLCDNQRHDERQLGRQNRIISQMQKSVMTLKDSLALVNQEKQSLQERCQTLEIKLQNSVEDVELLKKKIISMQKEQDSRNRLEAAGQLQKLEEVKILKSKLNSLDANRQVGIQLMKEKEEQIEQLNRKLLKQESEFVKLIQINKVLKSKTKKQTKFLEVQSRDSAIVEQSKINATVLKQSNELHTCYIRQFEELKRQMDLEVEAHKKSQQISQQEIQRLLRDNQYCVEDVKYLRQELGKLEELYTSILAGQEQQILQVLHYQVKNLSQQKQNEYECKLKDLMIKLCTNQQGNQRVSKLFDAQMNRLRKSDCNKHSKILQLEGDICNLRDKLGKVQINYDVVATQLKELRIENQEHNNQLTFMKTKMLEESKNIGAIQLHNKSLKEQLAQTQSELIRLSASNQRMCSLIEKSYVRAKICDKNMTELQLKCSESTRKFEAIILDLKVQLNKRIGENSALKEQNTVFHQQNDELRQELSTIPKLIEEEYKHRLNNLEEINIQQRQSKQYILQEKQLVFCRLKTIEKQYEKLKSEMVGMEAMMKIANKVHKRYSRQAI